MKRLLLLSLLLLISNSLLAQGWGQTEKIVLDERGPEYEFGSSVAMQRDIAAIGARSDNGNSSGSVYMYKEDVSGNWIQTQKLVHSDVNQFDQCGQSIAIDGNYMIVGARGQDYDASGGGMFYDGEGAAYIFEKDGSGNWDEVQKIVASDRGQSFQPVFGETVAISGNYAVVNKPTEESDLGITAGVCYIFERDTNGVWNEVQKIINSHRNNDDRFGDFSISISGNKIVVGSRAQDYDASGQNEILNAGAVYIFERDTNGVWNETQKIVATEREEGEFFGSSVAIDGNQIIVGASQEYLQGNVSAQYGAVYIFERDSNGFYNEIQKIRPNAFTHQSNFGHSLDVDVNHMIVGAHFMNTVANFTGAAFMFEKDVSGFWNQTAIMYDLDASSQDRFGLAVAMSGDFAIVGAHQDDEDYNGLNTISQAGSAYVFDVNEPNNLSTLSVVENDFSITIKVYSNPVEDILHIDLGNFYDSISLRVYNILGQTVYLEKYANAKIIRLDLINHPKGVYILDARVKGIDIVSQLKIIKH